MVRGNVGKLLGLVAVALVGWTTPSAARAEGPGCATCATGCAPGYFCQKHDCPPPLKHCLEGAPRIHFERGCPRPICNPCNLPNFGYFQTCWTPWPAEANWSHCSVPPPAAFVQLGTPNAAPALGGVAPPSPSAPLSGAEPLPPPTQRPQQPGTAPGTTPGTTPGTNPTPMSPGGLDVQPLPTPRSVPETPRVPGL